MKVGIMQPYFFPYLGHFGLIDSVDEWVVFDITQYTPKTWMNRNRILHPNHGWQYITVPLSNSSISIKTFEAKILNITEAKKTIIGKLSHYKKQAPYYHHVKDIVTTAFDNTTDDLLVNLNINALKAVCDYLGIQFRYRKAMDLAINYPEKMAAGDWAPYICSKIGATEYVNPIGGESIFDKSKFKSNEIGLNFSRFSEFKYGTGKYEYQPNLSILDVLMWNPPESIIFKMRENTTHVCG